MEHFPVIIIGAGPGGCAAALQLERMKIRSLLVDKAEFPREKVCGDALSGKVTTILNRIHPEILNSLKEASITRDIWGIRMVAPNRIFLDLPFKWKYDPDRDPAPGYVASRLDMDNFMIREVKKCSYIRVEEGMEIVQVERTAQGYRVRDVTAGFEAECQILLVANGANSLFTRQLTGIRKENKHYAGAVRGYFENVTGFHPDGFIELHFLQEYIPGYFWIFPLPGNKANVGLGLRSDYISGRRLNLRKELMNIIENYPGIRERFSDANPMGKIVGYPLPLGSKKYTRSGDHFMLLGDAAHLVDPITGEGVGNAMYSGWIAAEQVGQCLSKNRFDVKIMADYDARINRVMGVELQLSYQLQKLLHRPFLINLFARRLDKSEKLRKLLIRMYSDLDLRMQLVKPVFWLKVLTGRI